MNSKTLNFLNNAVKVTYSGDSNFKVRLKTKLAVPAGWVFDFSNNGTKLLSSEHCFRWMSTRHPHTDINFSWKKFKGEMKTLHNSFGHRFTEELPSWLLRLYKWKWTENCQTKSHSKKVVPKQEYQNFSYLGGYINVVLLTDNALPSSPFLKNPDLSVICKTVASKAEIAYTFSNHGTHLSARTLVGYNGPGKVSDDTPWIYTRFVKQIKYYKLIFGTKRVEEELPSWFKKLYLWSFGGLSPHLSYTSIPSYGKTKV